LGSVSRCHWHNKGRLSGRMGNSAVVYRSAKRSLGLVVPHLPAIVSGYVHPPYTFPFLGTIKNFYWTGRTGGLSLPVNRNNPRRHGRHVCVRLHGANTFCGFLGPAARDNDEGHRISPIGRRVDNRGGCAPPVARDGVPGGVRVGWAWGTDIGACSGSLGPSSSGSGQRLTDLSVPSLSQSSATLCLVLILVVPLAGAGLALVNTGLGRCRSAAHVMMASLCVFGLTAIVYSAVGFSWQGTAGRPAHVVIIAGKSWNWIAAEPFFIRGLPLDLSAESLIALLQMFSVGLAAVIPLSAGSDRWRLGASCASSALLAGWTYPLFAHWVWGGGWLSQLGTNCGLGRGFVDGGGASTIQAVGGLTALSITWILGSRRGKFSKDGIPAAIPGHNAVLVLTGCLLAWVGWLALNSAGAVLFVGVEISRLVRIILSTTLSAASSGLTAAVWTRARFGRPDASLTANGWMGGLVASSAAAAFLKPAAAILVGMIAGFLVVSAIDLLESRLAIDDPGGAVSVHAVAGIWGLLAVSLLSDAESSGQFLAQVAGIATLLGFVLPLTYGLNWLLNRFYPQRVDEEGERQGMDLYELGAGAYPEFVAHSDEFTQR
jgi:ammonium transporter, Amt family